MFSPPPAVRSVSLGPRFSGARLGSKHTQLVCSHGLWVVNAVWQRVLDVDVSQRLAGRATCCAVPVAQSVVVQLTSQSARRGGVSCPRLSPFVPCAPPSSHLAWHVTSSSLVGPWSCSPSWPVSTAAARRVPTEYSDPTPALAHTSSLDTNLTRNTRAPHFTPQHWLLCHMGLY